MHGAVPAHGWKQSSLAHLYDPLIMPPALVQAHHALDRAVDSAYGKKGFASDADRAAFLFGLYQKYTSLLPETPAKVSKGKRASSKRGAVGKPK